MLDLLIVLLVGAAGFAGYRLGLVARAVSWAAMLLGLVVGSWLLPSAVGLLGDDAGRLSIGIVAFGLPLAFAGLGLAGGLVVGSRARIGITSENARIADAAGGTVMGVLGVLVLVWLLAPGVADTSGTPARLVRGSHLARALVDGLPATPDATQTIRRLLGDGGPQVVGGLDRSPTAGAVPTASGIDAATAGRVGASVVKVVGSTCDSVESGTGWTIQPNVVMTNAHVVAGQRDLRLETQDGRTVAAVVLAIDPAADLAVLGAPNLDLAPLAMTATEIGQTGAVFGHPGGRPLEQSPFRIAARTEAAGRDVYGRQGVTRDLVVLAADIEHGDSGAPLIDAQGQVVAMVFATAPDRAGVAFAIATDEVTRVYRAAASGAIDPGACTR
jgi:S1-C subfamily serine protease